LVFTEDDRLEINRKKIKIKESKGKRFGHPKVSKNNRLDCKQE